MTEQTLEELRSSYQAAEAAYKDYRATPCLVDGHVNPDADGPRQRWEDADRDWRKLIVRHGPSLLEFATLLKKEASR